MRRVLITGWGVVSPVGNTVDAVATALRGGASGVRAMPAWREVAGLKSLVAGTVEGVDPMQIPRRHRRTMGRLSVLAAFAAQDAVASAGLPTEALRSTRTGIAIGSTTCSAQSVEDLITGFRSTAGVRELEGTLFMKIMNHTVAANLASMLGLRGELLAPCSACTSSSQAIGLGYHLIRAGVQDVMLCGGADELHPVTAGIFDVIGAASRGYNDAPHATPRPFDRDRDGLVVSEGASLVVLEAAECARARSAPVLGEVLGYACTSEARNMAISSHEGLFTCMRQALDVTGVGAEELSCVNAHATGTVQGDAAEAEALRALVGDRVPVSGIKGYTGHSLAACGAFEVIACLLMMRDGLIYPTRNLDDVAPDCAGIQHVTGVAPARARLDVVMTNNFAFGGVNTSLILGRTGTS